MADRAVLYEVTWFLALIRGFGCPCYQRPDAGSFGRHWKLVGRCCRHAVLHTWVTDRLQAARLVTRGVGEAAIASGDPSKPMDGLMLHQDASPHRWFGDGRRDLVITMGRCLRPMPRA